MFGFLKGLTEMIGDGQVNLESHFKIPLKLTPEFDVGIFNYVYRMRSDTEELYQPDVALSIDGVLMKPDNGMYDIRPGLLKIKYENKTYTIVVIRGGA